VNRTELIEAFRSLGAPDPEAWAASQIEEGIPQLHRYAFLKQAWGTAVGPDNTSWIENMQRGQGAAAGALSRLVDTGCSAEDLTQVVRAMQADLLFSVCYLLDCPDPEDVGDNTIGWGLFTCDTDDQPGEKITGLHESLLETDPCVEGSRR
jgi:hypothetical protein